MNKAILRFAVFALSVSPLLAQTVEVNYSKKKMPQFSSKVGIVEGIEITLDDDNSVSIEKIGNYRSWKLSGNGYTATATFYSDEAKGIWWEIKDAEETTTILLSPNYEDTNDPRDYLIKSTGDRGIFKMFNEEPDCNSDFFLLEAAESPTRLTGIAKDLGTITSSKPCDKGKWKIKIEEKISESLLIAFVFSSVQSLNVRYLEYLK